MASAGIEEFLTEFLPGLLAQPGLTGLAGPFTCTPPTGRPSGRPASAPAPGTAQEYPAAATTVQGTRSDLLLWLTNRGPAASITVTGRETVAAAWPQLRR